MRRVLGIQTCFCLGLLAILAVTAPRAAAGSAPVRIGMPMTFFHDVPKPLIQLVTEPFGMVMRDTTGLAGELVVGGDAFTVGKLLSENKLGLAVFHGFEFAWVQAKQPELRPLMVAVNSQRDVSAFVLVRKDCEAGSFGDLRGKEFSVPKRTKEHCRLYIDRQCHMDGTCAPKEYFSHVVGSANVETALDDLCQGKVHAVVVDSIGLEFYKDLKPGCFAKLRVLSHSQAFVPPVIAYRTGGLNNATLTQIRDGLRSAHKTEMGREMMKMWKITSFENVPANFSQELTESIKAYPAPK